MNCLVTGGAGFIGSHLVDNLMNDKSIQRVVVIDNLSGGKFENISKWKNDSRFSFVYEDIYNYQNIASYFDGIDIVFHNAASKFAVCKNKPDLDWRTNAWGTFNVAKACISHRVKKMVHASTGSVNGYKPKSWYGVSKIAAEGYLQAFKEYNSEFRYSILRYYHVYGERQNPYGEGGGVVSIWSRNMTLDMPLEIFGDGSQERCFTYVEDIVKANRLAASNEKTDYEIFPVVSDVRITIKDLAQKMCKIAGKEPKTFHSHSRLGDIHNFSVNNDYVKGLGLEFSSFDEKLKQTMEWYEHAD